MLSIEDAVRIATDEPGRLGLTCNDYYAALGIQATQRDAVRSYGRLGGAIGLLPIQVQHGRFDIVEGGQLAAILAAYWRLDSWPIDLVAVRLDTPQRAYRYLGAADALGEPEIDRARFHSCPLLKAEPGQIVVHASALDWLRGGCEGCAILDHKYTSRILSDIDEVVASPPTFASNLHKILYQRPAHLPRIMVPERESIEA
jgi:hypothetical protein